MKKTREEIPNTLKKLLEPYPDEIQLRFREAIERLHIQDPDDPIFELMLVLGLWGTYYQKISEEIVDNGQTIGKQNAEALKSLDERVRLLQGLAQTIQQATDQLTSARAEIVDKLPMDKIAHEIIDRLNKTIKSLPIEKLEKTLSETNLQMSQATQNVTAAVEKFDTVTQAVVSAAKQIHETGLPWVSVVWTIIWLVLGGFIGKCL